MQRGGGLLYRSTLHLADAHKAVLQRQRRMARHFQRLRSLRQTGQIQAQVGLLVGTRNPLQVLVTLAGTGSGAAVVQAQPAGLGHHQRQCGEIGQIQRLQLLGKHAARQYQMARGERKLVQDDGVVLADRADGQRRIGVQEGVEVGVTRATGNRHLGRGILGRQRGHPQHPEAHAAIVHLDLFRLHGDQVARSQRAGAAGIDGVHQGGAHADTPCGGAATAFL